MINNLKYFMSLKKAIQDDVIGRYETVYIGTLFNSPMVQLKRDRGKIVKDIIIEWYDNVKYAHKKDANKFFPYAYIDFENSSNIRVRFILFNEIGYEGSRGIDYETLNRLKPTIERFFNNDIFGLKVVDISKIAVNKSTYAIYGMYIELQLLKDLTVGFDDSDFPVLLLPKHNYYV